MTQSNPQHSSLQIVEHQDCPGHMAITTYDDGSGSVHHYDAAKRKRAYMRLRRADLEALRDRLVAILGPGTSAAEEQCTCPPDDLPWHTSPTCPVRARQTSEAMTRAFADPHVETKACPECHGTGRSMAEGRPHCNVCNGRGTT